MNDDSTSTSRYIIQDAIGAGGIGQVFLAWDQHLSRWVALKRLHADMEMEASIRHEAAILAGLNHPNIVSVYDFATDEIGPFAVMEYVQGSTLEDMISQQPLTLPAFVEMANQICRGLSAAHLSGLVHLDLKAGNLMFQPHEDGSFTCKILDFGLAHLQHEATAAAADGTIMGSPYTIAPEQLRSEPVDARTDLYSLGCVFYRALCGQEPFWAAETSDVLNRHLYEKPTPLHLVAPNVPEALSHALAQMMAREPADRPPSAEEARRRIQNAIRVPSANRPRPGSPGPPPAAQSRQKGRRGWAFVSLAVFAMAAGGALYHYQLSQPQPAPVPAAETPAAPAYPPVDPFDAPAIAQHKGETVTMEGVVTSVDESAIFNARFLKFSEDKPEAAVLSIGNQALSAESAQALVGKRVRATGRVSNAAKRNRLVVASETDLKVIP